VFIRSLNGWVCVFPIIISVTLTFTSNVRVLKANRTGWLYEGVVVVGFRLMGV